MSPPTDEDLMLAVKAGDRGAFEILYRRYRNRLHGFLVRYTGDSDTAQELFQETFLRVFRDRGRYKPRASFATWLFTIARNLYLDSRKHFILVSTQSSSETATGAFPDPAPGPLEELARREAEAMLRRALTSLPETDRAILLLSRFEGMRYAQIAEILGSSEGAVKVRAHRALQALRRAIKE